MGGVKLVKGLVVRSKAGRDKGTFLVVVEADEKTVSLCDGGERPLERPKRKNIRHVSFTGIILDEDSIVTNRQLRKVLRPFNTDGSQRT